MDKGIFKRLSIVLTIVYFLSMTGWQAYEIIHPQEEVAKDRFVQCRQQPGADRQVCLARQLEELDGVPAAAFKEGALIAGLTAGLFWSLIGIIYLVAQWILAGRSVKDEQ